MHKLTVFFFFALLAQISFTQKNIPSFNSIYSLTHAPLQKDQVCILTENVYGGGMFQVKEKNKFIIDSGIIFPTANAALVLVRKMDKPDVVYMKWFNVKDSTHNFMPAFNKATAYLKTRGSGTIIFDAGTFLAEPYFTINANNIVVKGAGQYKTFIKVSENAGSGLMVNSYYRDAGWLLNANDLITYTENSVTAGSKYIELKIKPDAKKLLPGTIIFINGGANYFDQNYGEFNIVDHYDNKGRVFLKYALSRSYQQNVSSWGATLTAAFKPPSEEESTTIQFAGTQPRGGTVISIGNDLYKVVSSTTSTAVVMNVKNKSNTTNTMPAGTHIFKYRAIVLTPSVVYNVDVQDMTITGKRKALTVSNTFKTSFKNITFNWLPQPVSPGGIWLDGDDGRDFKMDNCEINCVYLFRAQFARSFADIYISNTHFNQAGIQLTEYNINANITYCVFDLTAKNIPGEETTPVILLGNTCNVINFNNNTVHANNIQQVFHSSEIQGTRAKITSTININNNTIVCNTVGTLIAGAYYGNAFFQKNTITGSVNFLFNLHSINASCIVKDNSFTGYVDGFAAAIPNAQYINNSVKRLGQSAKPVEYNRWGNILYTHFPADTTVQGFIFKGNTFSNWNLLPNSFSHYWPLSSKTDISNNRFLNSPKDTIVTLK